MANTQTFKTTEAFISGAICGDMWMPQVLGGKCIHKNLRGPWGIMDRFTEPVSFRDALDTLLMEEGGDFQCARFAADTRITVIRKRNDGNGRYSLHVWERELVDLPSCADLVNAEAYSGDFFGDE
jgi:hypothetical protein